MKITKNTNILIIGLGLIGGSYAKALKKKGFKVNAIDKNQESISYGLKNKIIDNGFTEVEKEIIQTADLIIFTLYPNVFIEWIKEYGKFISSKTIVTDVTGVKGGVVEIIQSLLPKGVEFISAHPMAGRETSGVQNSNEEIFKNANYIVVPTEKNTEENILMCEELGAILGFSKISRLSVEEHDEMIGFLSQLTHCIAISLMTCNDSEHLVKYTGDSFRDLTRIAKINENMWTELFLLNKEALINQMDIFIKEFSDFRLLLVNGEDEKIKEKMRLSTKRRKYFDK